MKRAAGMTLIEVLVSIAILAMVGTMIWSGFSQTARNKQYIEQQTDRMHEVRATLERIVRELGMAYVSAQRNPDSSQQTMITAFVGKRASRGDRLDFTSFSHRRLFRNAKESDQNEISYFVTSHPQRNRELVLARREQRRVDTDPQHGGQSEILLEDIRGFELEYLDPLSGQWVERWDTTQAAMHPNRLPRQVKISLTIADTVNPREETTYVARAWIPIRYALNHSIYNP